MSIFSRRSKHNASNSQPASNPRRPKLYVLASQPAVHDQPQTTEWSLELSIPPLPAKAEHPEAHKHNLFSHFARKQADAMPSEPSSPSKIEPTNEPDQRVYFSRINPDSHSTTGPTATIFRIFLCSVQHHSTSISLESEIAEALSAVHVTPDSPSYLRQCLFALQTADFIPGVSHGLDINKFMTFATTYLAQHLDSLHAATDPAEATTINYSKHAKENERLRRMFHSTTTDYCVINQEPSASSTRAHAADGGDEDEDMWNHPMCTMPQGHTERQKSWGGFWFTHGSGAHLRRSSGQERDDPSPWERKDDVYGGLM